MTLHHVVAGAQLAPRKWHGFVCSLVGFALILAGCGGSDGEESNSSGFAPSPGRPGTDQGEVVVALTDADGDFLSYTVDMVSLTLLRQDGGEVQALPSVARVDFAQYRDLAEFVTAVAVPPGRYTSVRMVLDYSNADIQVEVNGEPRNAVVQDGAGNGMTTLLETRVELAAQRPLLVTAGATSHIGLDFDLDASHLVDTQVSPPLVKVEPVLMADIEPENIKPHRLRGVFSGVDRSGINYSIRLRPFHVAGGDFGTLTVYTTNATRFDVNGRASSGAGGLLLLGGQPSATPVVTFGELNAGTRRFVATEVYAGSSVPGSELDGATGHVMARSADVLTLRGVTVARRDGSVAFNDDVRVRLGTDTQVRRVGDNLPILSSDAISVGQRITVLGTSSNDQTDALTLDASAGFVRLHLTEVVGDAVSHGAGELIMNVQRIDGRSAGLFDFAGTGKTPPEDANAQSYQVDVGTLNLAALQPGEPVRVRGFVNAFGRAPPDFSASSVVTPAAGAEARLAISWDPPTQTPYTAMDSQSIALNTENMGALHHVLRRGVAIDIADLGMPTLRADLDGWGMFAIKEGRAVQVFRRFAEFSDALSGRLDGTKQVLRIAAVGEFDEANLTLVTRRATVLVVEP